jgi:hypothetical protein
MKQAYQTMSMDEMCMTTPIIQESTHPGLNTSHPFLSGTAMVNLSYSDSDEYRRHVITGGCHMMAV